MEVGLQWSVGREAVSEVGCRVLELKELVTLDHHPLNSIRRHPLNWVRAEGVLVAAVGQLLRW